VTLRRAIAMGALAIGGLAAGIGAVTVARRHPDLSLAGDATWVSVVQLLAGWALVGSGLAYWARHSVSRCGPLLAAAGTAWFAVEAPNPEIGSAVLFTAGLVLAAACPPLVGHATLAHGRTRTRGGIVAVVLVGYVVSIGVVGLLSAALYDPANQGCLECPTNLVNVGGSSRAAEASTRVGLVLLAGWSALVIVLLAARLVRASAAGRRASGPVVMPAAIYLGAVAADAVHGVGRGFTSNDSTDRALWTVQAVALIALAVGVSWERIRSARMRAELARLVVELDAPAGGVRDALARALGEPRLTLAYRATAGGWLSADGRELALPPTATLLGPDATAVAAVVEAPGAFADRELAAEIARAARPALEHERLQAEMRAQLAELRASRARIVEAADGERRRLERDLHDGAQQRIVALALDLRLARRQLARERPDLDAELGEAEGELRLAVAELRDVARGIHPPMLEDFGLAAALQALAEETPRLALGDLPPDRFPAPVESAAYHLVAETLRCVPERQVTVSARHAGTTLVLDVCPPDGPLIDAEDRIGALGGRLVRDGRATLRAELPCG
jgi:signal transduction histidine kinase